MRSQVVRVFCGGIVVSIALAGTSSARQEDAPGAMKPPAHKSDAKRLRISPVAVTTSKETTYITEPLRKDGRPDYVAALNQRFSRGVTPENNAAVPFWRAVGPGEIDDDYRETYFRMLGIPPLPVKGDYFVGLDTYIARTKGGTKPGDAAPGPDAMDDLWEQLNATTGRPWSAQEFPLFAEWLAANREPLALVFKASKHPRRYDPLIAGKKVPLIAVLVPAIYQYREVSRALRARAMFRLNEGKVREAWEDQLTCHRLARLAGQGSTVIDAIVAAGLCEAACAGDQVLLQHSHLATAQVVKMREDLNQLPEMPKMVDKFDEAERFAYLNIVLDYSREGPASLAELEVGAELEDLRELKNTMKSLIHHSASTAIDGDIILRMGNSWFDRIAAAYRKPTRAEQMEALGKIDTDFNRLKKRAQDTASLNKSMLRNRRKALSERLGQVLLTMLEPSIMLPIQIENRGIMRFELDKLAFALTAYRAELGSYPDKLSDLAPKYVAKLSKGIFIEAELRYRREGDSFLLYSFGNNGKDDGARSYTDCTKDEGWDDLVVRVPTFTMKGKSRSRN